MTARAHTIGTVVRLAQYDIPATTPIPIGVEQVVSYRPTYTTGPDGVGQVVIGTRIHWSSPYSTVLGLMAMSPSNVLYGWAPVIRAPMLPRPHTDGAMVTAIALSSVPVHHADVLMACSSSGSTGASTSSPLDVDALGTAIRGSGHHNPE